MVSWRRAFKGALAIIAWSFIWVVIGITVIAASFGFFLINPIITIACIIIGYIIAGLGVYAALLKISAEITAEEVERRIKK